MDQDGQSSFLKLYYAIHVGRVSSKMVKKYIFSEEEEEGFGIPKLTSFLNKTASVACKRTQLKLRSLGCMLILMFFDKINFLLHEVGL